VAAHNGIQPEVVSYLLSKDIKGMKYIHHTVINENADFFAPFLKVQESSTSTNQNFRIVNVKVQFDDGTIFDGSYVDGKPCEGTLTKTDGTSVYGKFSQDGKFVEGI
jgi:hypothetical protein